MNFIGRRAFIAAASALVGGAFAEKASASAPRVSASDIKDMPPEDVANVLSEAQWPVSNELTALHRSRDAAFNEFYEAARLARRGLDEGSKQDVHHNMSANIATKKSWSPVFKASVARREREALEQAISAAERALENKYRPLFEKLNPDGPAQEEGPRQDHAVLGRSHVAGSRC